MHVPSFAANHCIRVPEGMRLRTREGLWRGEEVSFRGLSVLTFYVESCPAPHEAGTEDNSGDDDSNTLLARGTSAGEACLSAWPSQPSSSAGSGGAFARDRSRSRPRECCAHVAGDVWTEGRLFKSSQANLWEGARSLVYDLRAEMCMWSSGFCPHALLESPLILTPAFLGAKVQTESLPGGGPPSGPACIQTKLLREPESRSLVARDRVEFVRDFELNEGRDWPYLPAGDPYAQQRLDDGQVESDDELVTGGRLFTSYLLTPGYVVEPVRIALDAPAEVHEVVQLIQVARDQVYARLFPEIIVIDPQPSQGYGLFATLPAWATSEMVVCFDLVEVDNRLFVTSAPGVATRGTLLDLAGLHQHELYDLYVGESPHPMGPADETDLHRGLCLFVVGRHSLPGPYFRLHQTLLSSAVWEDDPVIHSGPADGHICVVGEAGVRKVPLLADSSYPSAEVLAAALGLGSDPPLMQPATPVVTDISIDGYFCYNACAVATLEAGDVRGTAEGSCLALVDCRAMLQGWQLIPHC